jgi:hypothetical protein
LGHICLYGNIRNSLLYHANYDPNVLVSRSNIFLDFAAATTASMLCHPFHFAESRFVLNNRLPNFGAYKSIFSLAVSNKDYKVVFRGASAYLPINVVLALTGFNYFSSVNYYTYVL